MRSPAFAAAAALVVVLTAGPASAEPRPTPNGSIPPELLEQLDEILNTPGDTGARIRAMRILTAHKAGKPVPPEHVAAASAFVILETKINCPNGSRDPNDLRRKHELALYLMRIPLPPIREPAREPAP